MKNTEAVRTAFSKMQRQVEEHGAGYKIEPRVSPDGNHITLIIRRPKDSATAVYPDVMFHDDWYGKEIVRFSIHPTGYGEESLEQARQSLLFLPPANILYSEYLHNILSIPGTL